MELTPPGHLDVFCADIGSIDKRRFGWAHVDASGTAEQGEDIEQLVAGVVRCLRHSRKTALGFTCPLFVPVAAQALHLTRARAGEGSRPWSAVAGAGALAAGLTEVAWILEHIRTGLTGGVPCFFSWDSFAQDPSGLLLWEAFLVGGTNSRLPADDALRAVQEFKRAFPRSSVELRRDEVALSLVGAALLWSAWSTEAPLLREPCLVLRVEEPSKP